MLTCCLLLYDTSYARQEWIQVIFLQGKVNVPRTFINIFYKAHNPPYHDRSTLSRNPLLPLQVTFAVLLKEITPYHLNMDLSETVLIDAHKTEVCLSTSESLVLCFLMEKFPAFCPSTT